MILSWLFFSLKVLAVRTSGRITLGVAASTERFATSDFGSDKNDTLFSSQRFYYKISEVGADQWEVVSDLRNKYDDFGLLNKQQYQLDPQDQFQARQLSLRMVNPNGHWSPTVGRFEVPEAGAVFVDGGATQYRFNREIYGGFFAGLNPKQIDKSYLVSDPKAQHVGVYLTYQGKTDSWNTNSYLTHGFVQQKYNGQTERQFLYHNAVYQWQMDSRIISMAYFDFVPKSYIQTLNVLYQQRYNKYLASELGTLGIDVLEYQRRQNVLEKLDPSPYKENHGQLEYRFTRDASSVLRYSVGERSADRLKRTETDLGYRLQNFFSRNWDTQVRIFTRKNFTSNDTGGSWSLGYFSRSFELTADLDYAVEKNQDGTVTHPQNAEISLTNFFSKQLFSTLSLQRAADENVTILGSFLKIGYRFGSQDLPPIRDGAAPRGSL